MAAQPAPAPAMSWSDLANWNSAPADLPPPPPPPKTQGAEGVAPQLGSEDCMDPACADPMCAPLPKRVKGQPRASEMDMTKARLQEAMLGMAKDNKAAEIRELCSKGGLDAAYGNSIGQTALHIAGIWNAVEAGEALLDHGALIDAKNDLSGATPLHMAAMRGRREFCAMLVKRGADPTLTDDSGRVAADMTDDAELAARLRDPVVTEDLRNQRDLRANEAARFLADADAQRFREEGNALFRSKDYQQALEKYSAALHGWPDLTEVLEEKNSNVIPALLNRAACALELGDRAGGQGRSRQQLYENAVRDTSQALELGATAANKESAKALYRRGRALASIAECRLDEIAEKVDQEYSMQLREAVQRVPKVRLEVQSSALNVLRLSVQDFGAAMDQNKQLRLGSRQAREQLRLAEAQFLRVGEEPYLAVREDASQVVNVGAHAADLIFEAGTTWMKNQVLLELPIRSQGGTLTELPVRLHKQLNTNNFGELAVFITCSDHLGAEVLAQRGRVVGVSMKGELYGHLSSPSEEKEDLECANEFVMSQSLARTHPDTIQALVDKGLIKAKRYVKKTCCMVYSVNF